MTKRLLAFTLCVALALVIGGSAPPAAAQQDSVRHRALERTVRVSGEGTARAAPDEATLRFSIVTEAETAEAAREQNAEASSAALDAARELVPEEDLRLETLRLQPLYDYSSDERQLIGYEATRAAVARVEDLDVLPALVARVVERGANELDGIQYDLADRGPLRREALQEAAADARAKAQVLAQSLGVAVGDVIQISEQHYDAPPPRPYAMAAMRSVSEQQDAAPSPDAYAAGQIEVTARAQVTFALE